MSPTPTPQIVARASEAPEAPETRAALIDAAIEAYADHDIEAARGHRAPRGLAAKIMRATSAAREKAAPLGADAAEHAARAVEHGARVRHARAEARYADGVRGVRTLAAFLDGAITLR